MNNIFGVKTLNEKYVRINYFYCFVTAVLLFFLNEHIYYDELQSIIVNLGIFTLIIVLFIFKDSRLVYVIPIVGFLLNSRPREIHLVPIHLRGDFEYFSINSQKIGLFSFSTTALIIITMILALSYIRKKEFLFQIRKILWVLFLATLLSIIFTIDTQQIYFSASTQSLRFLLMTIGGSLFAFYYHQNIKNERVLYRAILFFVVVAVIQSIFYLASDIISNDFKLRYVTSSIFFLPFIFFIALSDLFTTKTRIFLPFIGLLVFFPITRGEQLIFVVSILITFLISFKKEHMKSFREFFTSKFLFIAVLISIILLASYLSYFLPSTWELLLRKLSFFLSGDLSFDQSTTVRSIEFSSILGVDSVSELIYLFMGKGFSGYYHMEMGALGILDRSDFSDFEINNNVFFSTHSFFSFFLLKFGVVGTLLIISFYLKNLFNNKTSVQHISTLRIILIPAILYMSYFSPLYCFYMAFITQLGSIKNA